jgi:hypothetical protein
MDKWIGMNSKFLQNSGRILPQYFPSNTRLVTGSTPINSFYQMEIANLKNRVVLPN